MPGITNRKPFVPAILAAIAILTGILLTQVKPAGALPGYDHVVEIWERAWNEILQYTPAGQYYETLFTKHAQEVQATISNDPVHVMSLWQVAEKFIPGMEALLDGRGDTVVITATQIDSLMDEMEWLASVGSNSLWTDIETELNRLQLQSLVGMTMDEALEYINASVPSQPAAEPTPHPSLVNTPAPDPVNQCVVGYQPDCLAEPTLVPGSSGYWAYYVLDEIYFEYPAVWRVELWAGREGILSLIPAGDSPEGAVLAEVSLFAGIYPDVTDHPYNPLTYPLTAWLRPTPFWSRLVSLPDFTGSEFLWTDDWDPSFINLEAIFHDPDTQTTAGVIMPVKNDSQADALYDPDLASNLYPNFHHILQSLRFW